MSGAFLSATALCVTNANGREEGAHVSHNSLPLLPTPPPPLQGASPRFAPPLPRSAFQRIRSRPAQS